MVFIQLKNPIKGNFTKAHLLNIHKFIFEDIYPFAEKIRREQISKADTMFYPPTLNVIRKEKSLFGIILSDTFKACTGDAVNYGRFN